MAIEIKRLMNRLSQIGEIGREPGGGVTRLAFSDSYFTAAEQLAALMGENPGWRVFRDGTGSVHAVRPGSCPELPQLVLGSHLDTVPNGGLYDGLAGVMAGLEVMCALEEEGVTLRHDLHLVAFNGEEAGPLGGTFASRALLGAIPLEGPIIKAALAKAEGRFPGVPFAEAPLGQVGAFLELHIEQGGVLDGQGIGAGAVTGIFGIRRYRIALDGQSNHAGTTPMQGRRDPMVNAARLISFVYQQAMTYGRELVATVGKVDVFPNLESVIPGRVELVLELRSLSDGRMDELWRKVEQLGRGFETGDGGEWPVTEWSAELQVEKPPVELDRCMVETVERACRRQGVSCMRLPSGAGHDAKSFAAAGIPTGMIFLPSIGGRSHCPQELTLPQQLERGTEVLRAAVELLDTQDLTSQSKEDVLHGD